MLRNLNLCVGVLRLPAAITATFMAMNVALSSFGVEAPGWRLYICFPCRLVKIWNQWCLDCSV